jgi:hypothetical protein
MSLDDAIDYCNSHQPCGTTGGTGPGGPRNNCCGYVNCVRSMMGTTPEGVTYGPIQGGALPEPFPPGTILCAGPFDVCRDYIMNGEGCPPHVAIVNSSGQICQCAGSVTYSAGGRTVEHGISCGDPFGGRRSGVGPRPSPPQWWD